MSILFDNNASGTLSVQAEIAHTTLTLQTNEGQLFPSPTGGDFFQCTLEDTSGNIEIVQCTAVASDVLTVTRAQENTTAKVFVVGSKVELRMTAATMDEFIQQSGDQMTGELDMNDQVLRDPILTGGRTVGATLRAADDGTGNQVVIPSGGGDPTIGGDAITHAGNDSSYVKDTRTITGGNGIDASVLGDLSANRTVQLDLDSMTPITVNELTTTEDSFVVDDNGTAKKIPFTDGGFKVVDETTTTRTLATADMCTVIRCTNASGCAVTLDTGVGKVGNWVSLIQWGGATAVTTTGSATVNGANGTDTAGVQYAEILLKCVATNTWLVTGDSG